MVQINSLYEQLPQLDEFKEGKINITKSDLLKVAKKSIASQGSVSSALVEIIDSYKKIDTNGDGISVDELQTYKNSKEGMKLALKSQFASSFDSANSYKLNLLKGFSNKNQSSSSLFGSSLYNYRTRT